MDDKYRIKVNIGNDLLIEVSGNDKAWVESQFEKLKTANLTPFTTPVKQGDSGGALSSSKLSTRPTAKRRGSSTTSRAQRNPELEDKLTVEMRNKLQAYKDSRSSNFKSSFVSQAVIIATFLYDELDWQSVDHDDLYTVYAAMGWKQPGNFRSTLNNARARNKYFSGMKDEKYILSHTGENYARHDSLDEEEQ